MPDPTTVNVALIIPLTGSDVGTWGAVALNPDFISIDGFQGGVVTVGVSNVPVTLTAPAGAITPSPGPTQSQNAVLRFTGNLTGNVQITLPLPGYYIVENLTTGAFVLSFRGVGAGEVIGIEQGSVQHIYNDGTNVRFVNLPPVGSYLDVCDAAVPAWISACTKPPYLNCNGTTFSAGTYPYLNAKLGGNTLPDLRGVSRYSLNQGTGRITSAGSGLDGDTRFAIKTSQTATLITANLPPYTPSGNLADTTASADTVLVNGNLVQNVASGTNGFAWSNNPVIKTVKAALAWSANFNGAAQGGTSVPFGVVGTGFVSGLMLIRAA